MATYCECCKGMGWIMCHCDDDCEVGRRRISEGRDPTDVEGDPEPPDERDEK
jgi:hypothetical protein